MHARGGDLVASQRRTMGGVAALLVGRAIADDGAAGDQRRTRIGERGIDGAGDIGRVMAVASDRMPAGGCIARSEEHTSELQSLMRISYAVFCLKKKTYEQQPPTITHSEHVIERHKHID